MRKKRYSDKAKCTLCGRTPAVHNSFYRQYFCEEDIRDCPGYEKIDQHLKTCPICNENYKPIEKMRYYFTRYKCYGLNAIIRKIRGLDLTDLVLKYKIQLGIEKCHICNEKRAKYFDRDIAICEKKRKDCPGFHDYMSKIHKNRYKKQPELKEKMSELMKEVQNREEVKTKKSDTMTMLHRGDCEPCKEFQKNFKNAHKKRRTDKYKRNKKYIETYRERRNATDD